MKALLDYQGKTVRLTDERLATSKSIRKWSKSKSPLRIRSECRNW